METRSAAPCACEVEGRLGATAPRKAAGRLVMPLCSKTWPSRSRTRLSGVVVAACSPHLHEKTFRRACSNAELNPYLMQMVNVREHISWVTKDKAAATDKATAMVTGAVERVKRQEPLQPWPRRTWKSPLAGSAI